ncbi:prolipoprotein diacylglyceryl transferase family protein [Prauserella oleivorans]
MLVGLGALVAIVLQALLAGRAGINAGAVLAVSLIGCLLGFVGGKVYYLVLHRKHPRQFLTAGACIQGFLLVALGVVAAGAAVLRIPIGVLLDATAPGVFLGMAVGRPGCWLTGCCAGRPTSSRWGLWSSDRRLATRRFPVQLVEAAVALMIGIVSLIVVLTVRPPIPGAIFVGATAAYTFGRQLLFPLRTESRTRIGRLVTMAICGLVLIAAVGAPIFA